jgi:hypothetical protein
LKNFCGLNSPVLDVVEPSFGLASTLAGYCALEDSLGQRAMAAYMAVPGQLAASHDGQERVLFTWKAVDLLLNVVVGLVLRVVDAEELSVACA